MKLLVDSCVAGAVARRLRADGHDVICVSDRGADPGDAAILALDSDFGVLVFRDGAGGAGVCGCVTDGPPLWPSAQASW